MSYIEQLAEEIHREVYPGREMTEDERDLYLIYAVLALAAGERVTRENVHDAWAAWEAKKDPEHRSLKPFAELSADVQAEDERFVNAIRNVARRRRKSA